MRIAEESAGLEVRNPGKVKVEGEALGLAQCCIEADVCKQIFTLQDFQNQILQYPRAFAPLQIQLFAKFDNRFVKKCINYCQQTRVKFRNMRNFEFRDTHTRLANLTDLATLAVKVVNFANVGQKCCCLCEGK